MLPSTWLVEHSRTLRARIEPCTRPRMVTSSAMISPWMYALSPITRPAECTSPSTRPSIWMSPVEDRVPLTIRSALMMDGAEERAARFSGGMLGADAGAGAFLLENMLARLDKGSRISHDVVVPDLVMHVGSGAAPCRSEPSDRRAFGHLIVHMNNNR